MSLYYRDIHRFSYCRMILSPVCLSVSHAVGVACITDNMYVRQDCDGMDYGDDDHWINTISQDLNTLKWLESHTTAEYYRFTDFKMAAAAILDIGGCEF